MQQHKREKEELSEMLKTQHSSEMVDVQQANQLAVTSLRETMLLQQQSTLREAAERHREEMAALQSELGTTHQAELSGLRDEHRNEMERHRQQLQEMLELRKKEVRTKQICMFSLFVPTVVFSMNFFPSWLYFCPFID